MTFDRQMTAGRLRLKKGVFDGLRVNRYKLSQMGLISYPTVVKYAEADDVDMFSGPVLYAMLSVGLGLSDSEIAELKLGDLFTVESGSE